VQTAPSKVRTKSVHDRITRLAFPVSFPSRFLSSPARASPLTLALYSSEHCSKKTLTCSTPNRPRPGRPQIQFEIPMNPKLSSPPPSTQRASKIVVPNGSSCPTGFTICPVAQPGGKGFEMACFDTTSSATHCGGCPPIGAGFWFGTEMSPVDEVGMDCTKMNGVASSDCIDSKCRVCKSFLSSFLRHS